MARGHHVEAWSPPTADDTYLPLSDLIDEHVVEIEWPAPYRRKGQAGVSFGVERSLGAMNDHCRRCAAEIDARGFDILFANACMFFRATQIGRHLRLPSVLYLQEPYRWLYEALPRLKWLAPPVGAYSITRPSTWRTAYSEWRDIGNARIQAREELANAQAFDRILVNSYFSRESVLRAYGLDSHVCYLGVDTERFVPFGKERERFLIGLGSITPEKNIGLCIEAVSCLSPPRPALVWVGNVGNPKYLAQMQSLAHQRGVVFDPRISISENELLSILNKATAMLYAPRLEPFGYAPLEANACGVPVVAVAEGGVRETVIHEANGLLVNHDARSMAEAASRLMNDPSLARSLGDAGRAMVKRLWNVDAAVGRLEAQLTMVATGRTSLATEVA
ncbi:glycosyltransferase family 4 protein [Methylosinus trichosporium]|uniref:glycosyltransferase family 4 protein n=1 Tax=Methylosinus trichosporium TaxID=426 RepID=UPI0006859B1F|nr:glycosyltransferase family 4 protein [Methylosinus trichosporium]